MEYAEAPVLITGDIDRGGIYASFIGTMEVLEKWERDLVAGFLVNRFRGDASLLEEAHNYVLDHTGKKVLGVIPFLHNLGLPEEDSVSFKEKVSPWEKANIEIALIDLPRISNFTDVDPFDIEEDVNVKIIRKTADLENPDLIIIPGSKSTVNDLKYLKTSGLAEAIKKHSQNGTQVFGICGGFQMLGREINDIKSIESSEYSSEGLQLLNVSTSMAPEKTLTRISLTGNIEGYEIHHGETEVFSADSVNEFEGRVLSVTSGNIYGTYLHGIFDNDIYRNDFLNKIRIRKGLLDLPPTAYNLEPAFDRLAESVRNSVDMDKIYSIMGL
jgi:cobyric acid synthase CobQ